MGILLAFAPFIVFAVVLRLVGPTEGLIAGTLTSAALLVRDWLSPNRSPKVLEIGTVVIFGALTLYALFGGTPMSIVGVRLWVDLGLMLVVLFTMVIRQPFTLQYARESVPQELWNEPKFLRTSYVITGVWALAFALMVAADAMLLYAPQVPARIGIIVTILALFGAIKFTEWYPKRVRAEAAT